MNIQNKKQWRLAFLKACHGGDLENVRHLCEKQYVDQGLVNIHCFNEGGFLVSCEWGHLEVIKYLLTSPELKEAGHTFANVHAKDDYGFRRACELGHCEVVRWLIMDYGMKKTSSIENILQDYPQAQEYFRAQEEQKEIEEAVLRSAKLSSEELKSDERTAKKVKKL